MRLAHPSPPRFQKHQAMTLSSDAPHPRWNQIRESASENSGELLTAQLLLALLLAIKLKRLRFRMSLVLDSSRHSRPWIGGW